MPPAAPPARRRGVVLAAAVLTLCTVPVAHVASSAAGAASPRYAADSSWTTFDQDSLRTGVDTSGNSFSPASPAWTATLDGEIYGQSLVYQGRVFVATENDTVYELAADTGQVMWSRHVGSPVPSGALPCGDISPTVGITSTPVIDPSRAEIFVVADEAASPVAAHHLVGLDLATGSVELDEVIDWPGSDPAAELQRASLALDQGNVVVGFGGNDGDCGDYHGLVVSAPEDGAAPSYFVVADQPGDGQGAVWMGGAAPPIDADGNIWLATGNSEFHSSGDTYDDSDGVLELSPSLQRVDYFAPTQWYADNAGDADLGSTAPALLPNGLVFQVGKATTAYVLRQSDLGQIGGQVASTADFCTGDPDGGSADVDGTLFVPCANGIHAVTVKAGPPSATWTASGPHDSPIVAGGLVWSIGGSTLYALDTSSGSVVQHFDIGGSASSFPSPSAADGLVLAPSTSGTAGVVHAFVGPDGLPGPPGPLPSCGCTTQAGPSAYDLVASDGGVFNLGDAGFFGSTGALHLNQPIVGMAVADGRGYWLVAADGGIFNFGDAGFFGSTGALHLNQPVVGMAASSTGYWLVARDGGIFNFGDAGFFGSTGALHLNQPIVGMAAAGGGGYWLVAADGGVFSFGDAGYAGSIAGLALHHPVVGMAAA